MSDVPAFGWRFVTLRGRKKVACARCQRKTYTGCVSIASDLKNPDLKLVCRRCFREIDEVIEEEP